MVDLSIIIVSWNVRDLLARCLDSIAEDLGRPAAGGVPLDYEVIVVDNGSVDGSIDMLRESFPWVRLVVNERNAGFTRANNQGLALSRGRHLLLLNPDTEILGDALQRMVHYLDAHPEVGILGPQLLHPDGRVQSSRRRFPAYATGFVESTILQRWLPRHPLLRRYYVEDVDDGQTQEVDWVVGACMMIRRRAFEEVGPLDERFFMYSEELDYAHRLKGVGWRVVYLPEARVIHHEAGSSGQVAAQRLILFHTSKVQFYEKAFGRRRATWLRRFLLASFAFQWLEEGLRWTLGHRRALRRQRMRAYCQALRSGLRPARVRAPDPPGGERCASA